VHAGPGQSVQQYNDVDGYSDDDADLKPDQQGTEERCESRYQIDFCKRLIFFFFLTFNLISVNRYRDTVYRLWPVIIVI
jgi:hypothetical protein